MAKTHFTPRGNSRLFRQSYLAQFVLYPFYLGAASNWRASNGRHTDWDGAYYGFEIMQMLDHTYWKWLMVIGEIVQEPWRPHDSIGSKAYD